MDVIVDDLRFVEAAFNLFWMSGISSMEDYKLLTENSLPFDSQSDLLKFVFFQNLLCDVAIFGVFEELIERR